MTLTVEVLYFDGCSNVRAAMDRLETALQEYGLDWTMSQTLVSDPRAATAVRFLGSPTMRINGVDIEPSARQRTDFGIMCRTYDGSGGVPPEDMIRSAIATAMAASR